jgi:excisionase family DNA binding protein
MTTVLERGPVAASESERPSLEKMEWVFEEAQQEGAQGTPVLLGPSGERIELPESVFTVLRQLVHHLAQGRVVMVVPVNKELTTQEAADILNVSRPYLVKLLDEGKIPFVKTGTHRRIQFADLMAYKRIRDAERKQGLARLTQLGQELGLDE